MNTRTSRKSAIGLAVSSAVALVLLAMRAVQLQAELSDATAHAAEQRSVAAASAKSRLSLPPARPLALCNDTAAELDVPVVAATYVGPQQMFVSYNSASDDWRSWTIPAHSMRRLANAGADERAGWDGEAVFYAVEVAGGDLHHMYSGTSNDLANGCIHVTAENMRQGN